MKTLLSDRLYRVTRPKCVLRRHWWVAALVLVLAGSLRLSAYAQDSGQVSVSAQLVADELRLAGVDVLFVTKHGEAGLQVFRCKDAALVRQLLDAIAQGTEARVVDRTPKDLSKPTDHLQFDADSKLITLAKYYAEEDLLSIPHFFYRKDRGKIIITPYLSKADREILRGRGKQIFLKPGPLFGPLLAKIETKEYLLGGGQGSK